MFTALPPYLYFCQHVYNSTMLTELLTCDTASMLTVLTPCLQYCYHVYNNVTMLTVLPPCLQYCHYAYSSDTILTVLTPCLQFCHHVYSNVTMFAILPSCLQYHQIYSSANLFTVVPCLQYCHDIYSITTSITVLYHVYSIDVPIQLSLEPPFVLHSSVPASPHMCQSCMRSSMATCSARRTAAGKSRAGPGTCVARSPSAP